ncbi:hypothetical protein [Mesorhizobium sp.]|uniref:hypothetical protein n=1 Tax=Mesorhizobium sp. TaxID=1871066 RepID=UPI000FE5C39D|nr:hypothetical protein [Mesorhizobium sp.]RWO23328.1 MAG: hypothetical protein EOS09_17020 [Mesorhizobium sp.]
MPTSSQLIETYRGSAIYHDAADGYYAGNLGYCDTLDDIKQEIDDSIAEEQAHYADIDTPPDTPSLAAPWWSER